MCPQSFHQSSPIIFNFIFSFFHWGRIQDIEFQQHGLPLPTCCMGKLFKISINYFVFLFRKGQTFVSVCFFRLSLATTTGVEACPCLSSFNYDSKGARHVGLTCTCHLSYIMADSMPVCCMGCQVSCGIVPNGPASLVISFNIHQSLKC